MVHAFCGAFLNIFPKPQVKSFFLSACSTMALSAKLGPQLPCSPNRVVRSASKPTPQRVSPRLIVAAAPASSAGDSEPRPSTSSNNGGPSSSPRKRTPRGGSVRSGAAQGNDATTSTSVTTTTTTSSTDQPTPEVPKQEEAPQSPAALPSASPAAALPAAPEVPKLPPAGPPPPMLPELTEEHQQQKEAQQKEEEAQQEEKQRRVNRLKLKLLASVASLDRGLAATASEAAEVESLSRQLESAGGPVVLTWTPYGEGSPLNLLQGRWRLLYTSGFNTGSLGGRRPGPPAPLVPFTLGQVYQDIDSSASRLDNIVSFLLPDPVGDLASLARQPLSLLPVTGQARVEAALDDKGLGPNRESPAVRLTLSHEMEVKGARTVEIVYEDTAAELLGISNSLPGPLAELPFIGKQTEIPQLPDFLRPPRNFRAATFDVVFLDRTMRITRGDRGELRIYLREGLGTSGSPQIGDSVDGGDE